MSKKELIEKRNALATRAEELGRENEKRELTVAEMAELAEIRDSIRDIKRKLGIADKVEGITRDATEAADGAKTEDKKEEGEEATEDEKAKAAAETRAFEDYIRHAGKMTRSDNTPLSKANNGDVIPLTIANRIIRKLYNISPILERSEKYNMKGTFAIPKYTEDTDNAVMVDFQDEFVAPDANSGSFETVNLTDNQVSALTKLSWALKNNVDFDVVSKMVEIMAYGFKRFTEKQLLGLGNTAKVEGLSGVTLITNAAAANAITADELIELQDSVLDDYQENAIWIMSKKTRTAIRQLKDNMGRYLLQDDISLPFGKTLLGKPVYVSSNMPDMEAGKVAIYYGDMSGLATKFTKEMTIRILDQLYATQAADGIYGYASFDAKVQDTQKIAKLVMGTTSA